MSPQAESLLTHLVALLWLTAGLRLLTESMRNDSRPDFLFGLGLLLGGLSAGWTQAPVAELGVWPGETLLLGGAVLWCFAVGTADEATGLEPGDRWPPVLALLGLAVLVHYVTQQVGPPPTVVVGLPFVPTGLIAVLLAAFAWIRTRRLPAELFGTLGQARARELLWCVLGAGLAGLVDDPVARAARCALLALGPASLLLHELFAARWLIARHFAVALTVLLGCGISDVVARTAVREAHLTGTVQLATALALAQPRLQNPVETAAQTMVREEQLALYQRRLQELAQQFAALRGHAEATGIAALQGGVDQLGEALLAHGRHAREAFDAVGMLKAAWGDGAAQDRARARLADCLAEGRLALERGASALQGLAQTAVAEREAGTTLPERARELLLALVVAITLVGLALLGAGSAREEPAGRGAGESAPAASARSRVLAIEAFEPRRWLDDLIGAVRGGIERRGLLLVPAVAADVPERLETDPRLLRDAVRLLVESALRRTRRGHLSITLELDLRQLVLHVTDTGAALSREQVRGALGGAAQDGAELEPLARAATLAQELGGRLLLASHDGDGTTATLRVPVAVLAGAAT